MFFLSKKIKDIVFENLNDTNFEFINSEEGSLNIKNLKKHFKIKKRGTTLHLTLAKKLNVKGVIRLDPSKYEKISFIKSDLNIIDNTKNNLPKTNIFFKDSTISLMRFFSRNLELELDSSILELDKVSIEHLFVKLRNVSFLYLKNAFVGNFYSDLACSHLIFRKNTFAENMSLLSSSYSSSQVNVLKEFKCGISEDSNVNLRCDPKIEIIKSFEDNLFFTDTVLPKTKTYIIPENGDCFDYSSYENDSMEYFLSFSMSNNLDDLIYQSEYSPPK